MSVPFVLGGKKKKKKKGGNHEDLSEAMARASLSEALLSTNSGALVSPSENDNNEWKTATSKGKSRKNVQINEAPAKPSNPKQTNKTTSASRAEASKEPSKKNQGTV